MQRKEEKTSKQHEFDFSQLEEKIALVCADYSIDGKTYNINDKCYYFSLFKDSKLTSIFESYIQYVEELAKDGSVQVDLSELREIYIRLIDLYCPASLALRFENSIIKIEDVGVYIKKNVLELLSEFHKKVLLLTQGKIDTQAIVLDNGNHANNQKAVSMNLLEAVREGDACIVQLLLQDEQVNPATDNNEAIRMAAENGHTKVVELLLADKRVNPAEKHRFLSASYSCPLMLSVRKGHTNIVKYLLEDGRINPAADNNEAIKVAVENNHPGIVELLLRDKRVNPAVIYSFNTGFFYPGSSYRTLLIIAARDGCTEIVRLLLIDKRINPAEINSEALMVAATAGHAGVVKLLLDDGRADPSTNDNLALKNAARYRHQGVLLLLALDKRINQALKKKYWPEISHGLFQHVKPLYLKIQERSSSQVDARLSQL